MTQADKALVRLLELRVQRKSTVLVSRTPICECKVVARSDFSIGAFPSRMLLGRITKSRLHQPAETVISISDRTLRTEISETARFECVSLQEQDLLICIAYSRAGPIFECAPAQFNLQKTAYSLDVGAVPGMFVKQLSDQGYSWKTGRAQIRVIHNFGQWLELNDINVGTLCRSILAIFGYRLRKWRPGSSDARALNHLLKFFDKKESSLRDTYNAATVRVAVK